MDEYSSGPTEQILRKLRDLCSHMADEDYYNDMFASTTNSLRTTMQRRILEQHEHKYVSGSADEIQKSVLTLGWTRINIPVEALLSIDYLNAMATLNLHDQFTDCLEINAGSEPISFVAFADPQDAMCFKLVYDTSNFS